MVQIILQEKREGLIEVVLILVAVLTISFWFSTTPSISLREVITLVVTVFGIAGIIKRSSTMVMTSIAIGLFVYSGPNVSLAF